MFTNNTIRSFFSLKIFFFSLLVLILSLGLIADYLEFSEPIIIEQVKAAHYSAAYYKDKVYVFYKQKDKEYMRMSSYDGEKWTSPVRVVEKKLDFRPSAVEYNGLLHLVYKGKETYKLYHTTYNGEFWTEPKEIKELLATSEPSICVYDNKLYMVHNGPGDSFKNMLFYSYYDGSAWTKDTKLTDILCYGPAGLAKHKDALYTVMVSKDKKSMMYSKYEKGKDWTIPAEIPGARGGIRPSFISYDQKLYLFYHSDRNNLVNYLFYDDGNWTGPYHTSDIRTSYPPAIVQKPGLPGQLHLFTSKGSEIRHSQTFNNQGGIKPINGKLKIQLKKATPEKEEEFRVDDVESE